MVKLRKDNIVLVYGFYTLLDKDNPGMYAYTRELNGKKFFVGIELSKAKVLISNYASPSADNKLQPYEAVIYEL